MWKRLTLSLVAVAALSALVMGASFALFTATTSNSSNTFTAGTVTLSGDFNSTVTLTTMVPGDGADKYYSIGYTGNVGAWLGLDTIKSAGGLWTCDAANSLTVTVDNGTNAAAATATYNSNALNQLLNTTPAVNGNSFPVHFHYSLPTTAGNTCQAQSATFTIGVHAVQAGNNPLTGSPAAPSWS